MMSDLNPARTRRQIAQRLSLRAPQEESLNILAEVLEKIDFV
jgi:type III restriction enzyme